MEIYHNSICSFNEIKEICKSPEKYFLEGLTFQIIEIGTNLSILLDIKNPNYIQSKILNNLSFFSHRYLLIKLNINNYLKDYTIGLGEDTERNITQDNKIINKTQLYIPDWSIYSDYSKNAYGVDKVFTENGKNIYKGKCVFSSQLNNFQTQYLINIHKYLFSKKYITYTEKKYLLIDLPFLYSDFGYFFSNNTKNTKNIKLNCRDFVYFFTYNPEWLNNITIDEYSINKIDNEWIDIKSKKLVFSDLTIHFKTNY